MKITYKATHNPFSSSRMFTQYEVLVGDIVVGWVSKNAPCHWWVSTVYMTVTPAEPFPTRRAAGEWLAAASGLWLVTR